MKTATGRYKDIYWGPKPEINVRLKSEREAVDRVRSSRSPSDGHAFIAKFLVAGNRSSRERERKIKEGEGQKQRKKVQRICSKLFCLKSVHKYRETSVVVNNKYFDFLGFEPFCKIVH